MASTRLPSIWSAVCRSSDVYNPALRSARAAQRIRAYHPARRIQQEQVSQRYGTANEPPPHLGSGKGSTQPQDAKPLPKIGEKLQRDGEKEVKTEEQQQLDTSQTEPATIDGRTATASTPTSDPMLDTSETSTQPPGAPKPADSKPLQSILNSVPDPSQHQSPQHTDGHAEDHHDKTFDEHSPPIKAPHMEPPRHIHHFDTYGLVKRLKEGGWDQDQAITVMKAMRIILKGQTDLAKDALVSKSNLENEAYLFKAAVAELRTEVTSRRKSEQEKMRTERTQLQHEVDILSQRLSQESAGLKDDMKGMFDDRKMAVRNEQRDMESKVQQLNYRITVELQSDAKSEVEGVRWIMTRRVVLTLGLVVLMIVGSFKLAAMQEAERAKPTMASGGTQTEFSSEGGSGRENVVRGGESAGYVSLG